MLLSEIRDEVKVSVNDSRFSDEMVDSYINDVYFGAVSECLVPDLKSVTTVSTVPGVAYTTLTGLTGGFSGVLSRVYNSDGKTVTSFNKLEMLMDLNGNLTDEGDVEAVVLEGSTLWYYRIPTVAEVLTLIYYKNPTVLAADSDSPVFIPDLLHRKILVHGASAIMFDIIEGGVEGLKVNTRSHEIAKEAGIIKFREWLGKTRKHYISSQEPI